MKYFFSLTDFYALIKTIFKPNECHRHVEDIDFVELYKKGFRTIFLDIDNTLMTYQEKEVSLQKLNWIEEIKMIGFHVFIISNNSAYKRVKKVSEQMGVFGLYFATKPFVFSARELANEWGVDFLLRNLDSSLDFSFVKILLGDRILLNLKY
ncbi:YqeG family HAD IIIA-type phosphatase [Candidatus Margulisiibacteriota bacterium]